ncbi:nucleoprotein TPR-like isoform X2 [Leptidea sinapis]|uniref:nucleoprotein TPR-like isoform X2 n=1 Tax=Leptidea sinapis TaxID=189913 RepID=UPI0021C26A04|nr:nucleoprotein TPR-like isoform X2 [Leptidea sinapis]
MSNRRESFKKSLGITAYPWSSDDDEDNPIERRGNQAPLIGGLPVPGGCVDNGNIQEPSPVRNRTEPSSVRNRTEPTLLFKKNVGLHNLLVNRLPANYEPSENVRANMHRMIAISALRSMRRPSETGSTSQPGPSGSRRTYVADVVGPRRIYARKRGSRVLPPRSSVPTLFSGTTSSSVFAMIPLSTSIDRSIDHGHNNDNQTENDQEQRRSVSPEPSGSGSNESNAVEETENDQEQRQSVSPEPSGSGSNESSAMEDEQSRRSTPTTGSRRRCVKTRSASQTENDQEQRQSVSPEPSGSGSNESSAMEGEQSRRSVPTTGSRRRFIKTRCASHFSLPSFASSRNVYQRIPRSTTSRNEAVDEVQIDDDEQENDEEPERNFSPVEELGGSNEHRAIEVEPTASVNLEDEIVEIEDEDGVINISEHDTADVATQIPDIPPDGQQQHTQRNKKKRDDDDDIRESASVKDFNQKLLRLLECPVCLEWMEAPLPQCERGHLLCRRCRARLPSCPLCRTPFSSVRNRAMEAVAELVRYPCRHGCGRETRLRRHAAHEANCPARWYHCPAHACSARDPLPLPSLRDHFLQKHPTWIKVGRPQKMHINLIPEQNETWILMCHEELFHLKVDAHQRHGVVLTVAYIGPMSKAKKFIYEVTVVGLHNSRMIVYRRNVHSDLELSQDCVSRKDCFHLPPEQALNMMRIKNRPSEPHGSLQFTVDVTRRAAAPAPLPS